MSIFITDDKDFNMDFIKFAGLELLRKSYIKNLVIERLDSDPSITDVDIGRIWFNKNERRFKVTLLDDSDGIVIKSLSFFDELNDIYGTSLIGYEGWTGIYGKFNIPEGTLKDSLDLIADKIDENTLSIDDINNGSIYNLQEELNHTQYSAGLSIIDGSYTPDPSANFIHSASTLFEADQILDAKLSDHDGIISDISESIDESIAYAINDLYDYLDELQAELDFTQTIEGCGLEEDGSYIPDFEANYIDIATNLHNADSILDSQLKIHDDVISDLIDEVNSIQSELDFTQDIEGAGLNEDGSYTPDPSANYIDVATNLYNADQILDGQVKTNTDNIYNLNENTNIYDISEDIYGNPLWKGDRWPVRDDLIYKTTTSYGMSHVIEHNLDTQYILVNAWIKDPSDGKFKSDIVNVVIEDNNTISIDLPEPRELMLVIESK